MARRDAFCACIHEYKAACAIGVLGHTDLVASLAKGRRLLIASHTRHLDRRTEKFGIGLTKHATGWHDVRQHGAWNTQFVQNHLVPVALINIIEQRARGVGGIGDVDTTL